MEVKKTFIDWVAQTLNKEEHDYLNSIGIEMDNSINDDFSSTLHIPLLGGGVKVVKIKGYKYSINW